MAYILLWIVYKQHLMNDKYMQIPSLAEFTPPYLHEFDLNI